MWGKILVVVGPEDSAAAKSFANLVGVKTITQDQLNTFDVLVNDFIVFTKDSFNATCEARPAPAERKAARVAQMQAAAADAMADVIVDDAIAEERAEAANEDSAEQSERSEAAIANEEEE